MGVIGRPHGVRGLVRLATYASTPGMLTGRPLRDDRGRLWTVAWRGEGIAQLSDANGRPVADRNEAETLTNLRLTIDRAALPEPEPDEFYLADLIGLEARDETGRPLGRVDAVHDYGAGVSLEIAAANLIVPFTRAAVPAIDVAGGHLTIVAPDEIEVRGDLVAPGAHEPAPAP